MTLTHTQFAEAAVEQALEAANEAIGRLDDLLTDNQLSPQMLKKILKSLKLDLPDLSLEEWCLENIDADAVADEPLLKTPFLKSVREMRMLFGAAMVEWPIGAATVTQEMNP